MSKSLEFVTDETDPVINKEYPEPKWIDWYDAHPESLDETSPGLYSNFIVCCDSEWGIAKNGSLPWSIKEDSQWFKNNTINQIVIMGRKTYDAIGKFLPDRHNIVVASIFPPNTNTTISDLFKEDTYCNLSTFSIETAWKIARIIQDNRKIRPESIRADRFVPAYAGGSNLDLKPKIFIIGGAVLWTEFIKSNLTPCKLFLTKLSENYDCDLKFPIDLLKQKVIEYTETKTVMDRNTQRSLTAEFSIIKISRSRKGYALQKPLDIENI